MKMLQKRQGVEAATMARVNKARLQTLLTEVQNQDQSQERYQASLECVPFERVRASIEWAGGSIG
jgi:predicted type IV restriction endonuclease